MCRQRQLLFVLFALPLWSATSPAQQATRPASTQPQAPSESILSEQQWVSLNRSAGRGLAWLASQQQPDGSFRADDRAQPAITALSVLAFLSCGREPGEGPYSDVLERAVAYVLSCRQPDGLLCRLTPETQLIERGASHTATYNHAMSGLMLSEIYGMASPERAAELRDVLRGAVQMSLTLQHTPAKRNALDEGGWRYVRPWYPNDSDITSTAWHLMFLRSARNAGFDVPAAAMDQATAFVERCFQRDGRVFYGLIGSSRRATVATVGAGVLSFSLAGHHQTDAAQRGGEWLLGSRLPYKYGAHRFHYHAFYYAQALHQLGGKYWSQAYPPLLATLIDHQLADGSWRAEVGEEEWGPCLSTSLAILTISVPYRLLPIYQR